MNTKFKETKARSIVKALSHRTIIIAADVVVIFWLTHRYDIALTVVVVSNIYSTVLYFVHERVWDQIKWGRSKN